MLPEAASTDVSYTTASDLHAVADNYSASVTALCCKVTCMSVSTSSANEGMDGDASISGGAQPNPFLPKRPDGTPPDRCTRGRLMLHLNTSGMTWANLNPPRLQSVHAVTGFSTQPVCIKNKHQRLDK